MTFSKILNWIKLYYFSGNIEVTYETEIDKNWPEIVENFKKESKRLKYNGVEIFTADDYILVDQNSIPTIINRVMLNLNSEITKSGNLLKTTINADLGDYSDMYMIFWKGAVFCFTLIYITLTLLNLFHVIYLTNIVIFTIAIISINSFCLFWTYYLINEADELNHYIMKIVNQKS